MAVIGLGIDLVDVADMARRIESGTILKAFSDREKAYADSRPKHRFQIFAAQWAGKEAFGKALGTGLPQGSIGDFKKIEVLRDDDGKPYYEIGGRFADQVPEGARVLVSLTHTEATAAAVAIIES